MLQDSPQTSTASQVDLMAIDALFKRIAERGRKVRARVIDNKEQDSKLPKDMPSAKDNQKVGK